MAVVIVSGTGVSDSPFEHLYSLLIFSRSVELKPLRWPMVHFTTGWMAMMVGLEFW